MKTTPAATTRRRNAAFSMCLEGLESRQLMAVGPIVDEGAVRLETNLGRITFLLSDATPITTENFLRYVRAGRYTNVLFHRSVDDFVVQGGGFTNDATKQYPAIQTFAPIVNEFEQAKAAAGGGKVNLRGTVSMAKLGSDPNSATSQFFISVNDNSANLDVQNGGFTVFARVIGGGLHVADAINNLNTVNYSFFNQALTDVPQVKSPFGTGFVAISSARAQRVLPVTLDASTRFVTWEDENGGTATITLSGGGKADLTFIGGTDMQVRQAGNHVYVTGNNVTLDEVSTRNTNKRSVLAVKSVAGAGPSHIGSITVNNGHLARIDADSVQVRGDITADGSIGYINLQGTYRSTISTVGGSLNLVIKDAVTTSVNIENGTLNSFLNRTWFDDNSVPTSISAKSIGFLELNGNFSSDITTTGDVNRIVIDGNIGNLGGSTWTIGGSLKDVSARKVMGLNAVVARQINNFRVNEIQTAFGSPRVNPKITARYIGNLSATSLSMATISSTQGIGSVNVSGPVNSSVIRSDGNIKSITIGGALSGNTVGARATRIASAIYAGVDPTILSGMVTDPADFTNKKASIGSLVVRGTLSNTTIAAPTLGTLRLGTVQVNNQSKDFGIVADKRVGSLTARTSGGKSIALPAVTTQAQVSAYFSQAQIKAADLRDFDVRIV